MVHIEYTMLVSGALWMNLWGVRTTRTIRYSQIDHTTCGIVEAYDYGFARPTRRNIRRSECRRQVYDFF